MTSTALDAAPQPASPQSAVAPTVNATMGLTEWLFIFVLSIIWGGRLDWNARGGMLLIFAGLVAIDGRLFAFFVKTSKRP